MKKIKFKALILICFSILSFAMYGQTNVIAVKSQAGEMADVLERADNFGEISPRLYFLHVDSVQFFKEQKMYVRYIKGSADTVSFQHLPDSLVNEYTQSIGFDYPETTKFIDFPNGVYQGACNTIQLKKNSLSIWGVLLALLFVGGVITRKKSKA